MRNKISFDDKLDKSKAPEHFRTALIETCDTLDMCWRIAIQVFDAHAKPEHALNLLPLVLARADAINQAQLDDYYGDTPV